MNTNTFIFKIFILSSKKFYAFKSPGSELINVKFIQVGNQNYNNLPHHRINKIAILTDTTGGKHCQTSATFPQTSGIYIQGGGGATLENQTSVVLTLIIDPPSFLYKRGRQYRITVLRKYWFQYDFDHS